MYNFYRGFESRPLRQYRNRIRYVKGKRYVGTRIWGYPAGNESRGKEAIVLSADKFEDLELYVPVFRLISEGWLVDIAAPQKGHITGESNWYYIKANKTIDDINPDDYDFLLIPGGRPGGAPTVVQTSTKAQAIAQSFFSQNKPVAAICHGPWLLVSAGLVRGRHLTSYWGDGVPQDIQKAGGIWEDKDVVVDGNLVTSRWPMDIAAFTREMMKMIKAGRT